MSRQSWLRARFTPPEPVDPRPLEAAQLDPRADTMRDMVRDQVSAMMHEQEDAAAPDDDFVDDDEFHLEDQQRVLSNYQVDAYAEYLLEQQDPLPDPPAEPVLSSPPRSEEDNSSTQSSTAADPSHSTQA